MNTLVKSPMAIILSGSKANVNPLETWGTNKEETEDPFFDLDKASDNLKRSPVTG